MNLSFRFFTSAFPIEIVHNFCFLIAITFPWWLDWVTLTNDLEARTHMPIQGHLRRYVTRLVQAPITGRKKNRSLADGTSIVEMAKNKDLVK